MVYCGPASKGCQGCRTRRIKCDKKTPECSQCVRAKKPCSGYRDQLSLMFRDESTKIIEKAKRQWGVGEGPSASGGGGEASISPSSSAAPPSFSSSLSSLVVLSSPPPSSSSSSSSVASSSAAASLAAAERENSRTRGERPTRPGRSAAVWSGRLGRFMPQEVAATKADQAVHYYVQKFVIGYPGEAKEGLELRGEWWVHSPVVRDGMAAIGLASMANLRDEKGLMVLASERYGSALNQMVRFMSQTDITTSLELKLRIVVLLGLFEQIRGSTTPMTGVRTHLMGGAALIRTFLHTPIPNWEPRTRPRDLLAKCLILVSSIHCSIQQNSLQSHVFIPTTVEYAAGQEPPGDPLPQTFLDIVQMGLEATPPRDRPAPELLVMIMGVIQLAMFARRPNDGLGPLADGDARTHAFVADVLAADDQLAAWEWRYHADPVWCVREERFPPDMDVAPEAVFGGCYHVYVDMFCARLWNYYRSSRITTSQMLVEAAERFPASFQAALAGNIARNSMPPGLIVVAGDNDAAVAAAEHTATATAAFDPGPAINASSPTESSSTHETERSSESIPPLPPFPPPPSLTAAAAPHPQAASLSQASVARLQVAQAELRRVGRDVLVSVPTHWRHPLLTAAQRALVDRTLGSVGVGAEGVASTLFHIKLAACAPGVPRRVWAWAVDMIHTVWSQTGMLQARVLADWARKHREEVDRREAAAAGPGVGIGVAHEGQLGQEQEELGRGRAGGGGGGGLWLPAVVSSADGMGPVFVVETRTG